MKLESNTINPKLIKNAEAAGLIHLGDGRFQCGTRFIFDLSASGTEPWQILKNITDQLRILLTN